MVAKGRDNRSHGFVVQLVPLLSFPPAATSMNERSPKGEERRYPLSKFAAVAVETGASYLAHSGHRVIYDEAAGAIHVCEGILVNTVFLPSISSPHLSLNGHGPPSADAERIDASESELEKIHGSGLDRKERTNISTSAEHRHRNEENISRSMHSNIQRMDKKENEMNGEGATSLEDTGDTKDLQTNGNGDREDDDDEGGSFCRSDGKNELETNVDIFDNDMGMDMTNVKAGETLPAAPAGGQGPSPLEQDETESAQRETMAPRDVMMIPLRDDRQSSTLPSGMDSSATPCFADVAKNNRIRPTSALSSGSSATSVASSRAFLASIGADISLVRASSDGRFVALRGSGSTVEVRDHERGTSFVQDLCKADRRGSDDSAVVLHGFFWLPGYRPSKKASANPRGGTNEKAKEAEDEDSLLSQTILQQTVDFLSATKQSLSAMAFGSKNQGTAHSSTDPSSEPHTPRHQIQGNIGASPLVSPPSQTTNDSVHSQFSPDDTTLDASEDVEERSAAISAVPMGAALVAVTTNGFDAYICEQGAGLLKVDISYRINTVQWYVWSPSTRILVVGTGSRGTKLACFQFNGEGRILRLPWLDLSPPWGSPAKQSKPNTASPSTNSGHKKSSLKVSASHIWIIVVSFRVYIAYWDGQDTQYGVLKLYRLYRDHVVLSAEINLSKGMSGSSIDLSVVDNALLIHGTHQGRVQVVDLERAGAVGMDITRSVLGTASLLTVLPLCDPAPLGILYNPSSSSEGWLVMKRDGDVTIGPHRLDRGSGEWAASLQTGHDPLDKNMASFSFPEIYQREKTNDLQRHSFPFKVREITTPSHIKLLYPDWLVDTETGAMCKLYLNLSAISTIGADTPTLVAFLQRRRISSISWQDPRCVTLQLMRKLVAQRIAPPDLRAAFHAMFGPKAPSPPILSPTEVALAVLAPLMTTEMAKDHPALEADTIKPSVSDSVSDGGMGGAKEHSDADEATLSPHQSDVKYLLSALTEMLVVCSSRGIQVDEAVAKLLIDAHIRRGRKHVLPTLLRRLAPLLSAPVYLEDQ